MAKEKTTYEMISKAPVSLMKNLVISYCSRGGFTLAQQMVARDGNHEVAVFLKGAVHINDIEGLERVRDMFSVAIDEARKREMREAESDDWDY